MKHKLEEEITADIAEFPDHFVLRTKNELIVYFTGIDFELAFEGFAEV